ncbi:MAG: hypothetical protein HKP27_16235, partial [Myxococcales bacterium]|nr:hypothetical protein [Myxococcales bacterium]
MQRNQNTTHPISQTLALVSLLTFALCLGFVGTPSEAPQAHVHVEDFAGGEDPQDHTIQIQRALDHANGLGRPVVVHFQPNKCYYVSKHGGGTPGVMPFALKISNASSITLAGHGAELRCTDRESMMLFVENSSHIKVRNLRFD